jgi:hypothetical protein
MVLYDPSEKPFASVRVATLVGGRVELAPAIPVDGFVSHYYHELGTTQTAALGAVATQVELGLVFERGDQYVVLWPGRWQQPEVVPKPFGKETVGVMHTSKSLYCLHRSAGAVRVVGEAGPVPPPVAQPILQVKQLLRARPYNDLLAVGVSAAGRPAVGLLGGRGWHAYELPEGAIVHDVYWPGDLYRFRVTYTLPGEVVEPENLKEVEFLPLDQRRIGPDATLLQIPDRP